MTKIILDSEICVGSGNCVLTDPDVFDQDDDGIVVLLDPDPSADHDQDVQIAVRRCPSGALRLAQPS